MIFLAGPRQSGKTTLSQELLSDSTGLYLNFDDPDHRKLILQRAWNDEQKIVILDEIHKYSRWKNFVKGTYDTQGKIHQFVITGSAKLDIYRHGQDSLLGRYFHWRLHPFCLAELKARNPKLNLLATLEQLSEHSGFPEPFLQNNSQFTARWRKMRQTLIFREDIRDLEQIKDITLLEQFRDAIAQRAGQLLVLSNIARDLEIAPKTANAWLQVLERSFVLFTIKPFTRKLNRAILKPPKAYFFDMGEGQNDEGNRFENLVALHLLKRLHYLEDSEGRKLSLHYVRDKEGHEVDFLIAEAEKPVMMIEVKLKPEHPSSLIYFSKKLKIKNSILLVKEGTKKTHTDYITYNAAEFLSQNLDAKLW